MPEVAVSLLAGGTGVPPVRIDIDAENRPSAAIRPCRVSRTAGTAVPLARIATDDAERIRPRPMPRPLPAGWKRVAAIAAIALLLLLPHATLADDAPAERLPVPKSARKRPMPTPFAEHRPDYASRDAAVHLGLAQDSRNRPPSPAQIR